MLKKIKNLLFPDYRERIIKLMEYKQRVIWFYEHRHNKIQTKRNLEKIVLPIYFNPTDYENISNISKKEARDIVKEMLHYVEDYKTLFSLFGRELCPFCIIHCYNCKKCSYGEEHLICERNNYSTYTKIYYDFLCKNYDVQDISDECYNDVLNILKGKY